MDFTAIKSRDDIFEQGITASIIVYLSDVMTDDDRDAIRDNLGSVWVPYTLGKDSVKSNVLKMPFYEFLLSYGVQGDIQGVKKYCSHNVDFLRRDYNVLIGELFIQKYGKEDPISKVISLYIYDHSYYGVYGSGVAVYQTQRGDTYRIDEDGPILVTEYLPRRALYCNNGDKILKTGYCYFYNCVPLSYYDEVGNDIDIMDIDGNMHSLVMNDDKIIISGYENLPSMYHIQNKYIMDVFDIYNLMRDISPDDLIKKYNMDYRVINALESILKIEVWNMQTVVRYKNGLVDGIFMDPVMDVDGSLDVDGKTLLFKKDEYINFNRVEYTESCDVGNYFITNIDKTNIELIGPTMAI